jgi:hypothetical protein
LELRLSQQQYEEIAMKARRPLLVLLFAVGTLISPLALAQKFYSSEPIPEYNASKEARFTGVVVEVKDHVCPISGGMGSHLMIEIEKRIYEVHLAPVRFLKMYKPAFHKGDTLEIVGVETKFQDVDAIIARNIKRGNEDFMFRDVNGKPFW